MSNQFDNLVTEYITAQDAFIELMDGIENLRSVYDIPELNMGSCQILQRFFGLQVKIYDDDNDDESFNPLDFDEDHETIYGMRRRNRQRILEEEGIIF